MATDTKTGDTKRQRTDRKDRAPLRMMRPRRAHTTRLNNQAINQRGDGDGY